MAIDPFSERLPKDEAEERGRGMLTNWTNHDMTPKPFLQPDNVQTIRLLMKRTVPGSLNGRDVLEFENGQEYDLPLGAGSLAEVFMREGWAQVPEVDLEAVLPSVTGLVPTLPRRRGRPRKNS